MQSSFTCPDHISMGNNDKKIDKWTIIHLLHTYSLGVAQQQATTFLADLSNQCLYQIDQSESKKQFVFPFTVNICNVRYLPEHWSYFHGQQWQEDWQMDDYTPLTYLFTRCGTATSHHISCWSVQSVFISDWPIREQETVCFPFTVNICNTRYLPEHWSFAHTMVDG